MQKKNSAKSNSGEASLPQINSAPPVIIAPGVSMDAAKLTDIVRAVVLEFAEALPEQMSEEELAIARRKRGRQYAVRLRDRMKQHRAIYNAAWFVRHSEATAQEYREEKMREFWQTCMTEFQNCGDIEAFTYAVADALTCYRYGFPWEG
jgi:hypothetical protein